MNHTELLAPAGDARAFKAAIAAGATAVYFGLTRFSARTRAKNITLSELASLVPLAKAHGVKLYLTINTLLLQSELLPAVELAEQALGLGVDALIVQDVGLLSLLSERLFKARGEGKSNGGAEWQARFPHAELHASTQMTTHNSAQTEFLAGFGVSQLNLSRELPLKDISRITSVCAARGIKTEVFVHGAFCVSFSGQCYLSGALYGEQGNRGSCVQPCRRAYRTIKEAKPTHAGNGNAEKACAGGFVPPFHLKDNCAFLLAKDLIDAGVSSLKIEGRIKNAEYVYAVTSAWNAQLLRVQQGKPLFESTPELTGAINRGYTCGYARGAVSADMFSDGEKDVSLIDEGTVTRYHADAKTLFVRGIEKSKRIEGAGRIEDAERNESAECIKGARRIDKGRCIESAGRIDKGRCIEGARRIDKGRCIESAAQTDNTNGTGVLKKESTIADASGGLKAGDTVIIKAKDGTFVCSLKIEEKIEGRIDAKAEARTKGELRSKNADKSAHGAHASANGVAYPDNAHGSANGSRSAHGAAYPDSIHASAHGARRPEAPEDAYKVTIQGKLNGKIMAGAHVFRSRSAVTPQQVDAAINAITVKETPIAITVYGSLGGTLRAVFAATCGGIEYKAQSESASVLCAAKNGGVTPELLQNKLGRLGGTGFCAASFDASACKGGLFVPTGELNAMRRSCVESLKAQIASAKGIQDSPCIALAQQSDKSGCIECAEHVASASGIQVTPCIERTQAEPCALTAEKSIGAHDAFRCDTRPQADEPAYDALGAYVASHDASKETERITVDASPLTPDATKGRLSFICAEAHIAQHLLQNGHTVLYELSLSFTKEDEDVCFMGAIPCFPPILLDEDMLHAESFLHALRQSPSFKTEKRVCCANTGLALRAAAMGFTPILAMQLNITNDASLLAYKNALNAAAFVPSCELSARDVARLNVPRGVELWYPLYAEDELMQSRQCLVKRLSGCTAREVTRDCILNCQKSVLCTGTNGEKLRAVKRKGRYSALYPEHIVSNAPFVPLLRRKVDVWTVDLRFMGADSFAAIDDCTQKAYAILKNGGACEAFDAVSRRSFFMEEKDS